MLNCLSHQEFSEYSVSIVSFDLLPPTLTMQEHVTLLGAFKPCAGIGFGS